MALLQYDRNEAGAYVDHLSKVNERNSVVATEDVRNKNGVLLVAKGMRISASTASKLIKHKLSKPIEYSVNVENHVNSKRIFDSVLAFNANHSDLKALFESLNLGRGFESDLGFLQQYPVVMQKLTVLKERLPRDYDKALFCCWFGYAIAKRLNSADASPIATAVTGLLHDVGMLHIDPNILNKEGELSPEEWRTIQSHTLIGELFLKEITSLPHVVPKAVAQHHERCDGGGYPRGLFGNKMTLVGQIVALCDSLYAIRFNPKNQHQSLKELISVVQINLGLHFKEIEQAAISLIREAELPTPPPNTSVEKIVPYLKKMVKLLSAWSWAMPIISSTIPLETKSKALRSARILSGRLSEIIEQSGMVTEGIERWIHIVGESPAEASVEEMQDLSNMYREFNWRCRELKRNLILGLKDAASQDLELDLKKKLVKCATILSHDEA
ncbi:MAG: hypothetical protein CMF25_01875 [Kangiellaceae bacterium]|nr:hypothetical protein [Kangiellaceae bacterium]|tara:strand:+ start:12235 stop:13560 length:1326 start_codon:yes stop_codon:yes gene_type:complete